MRVLLVAPIGERGGAERALAGLARRMPEHGIEPTAVLLRPGPLEEWLNDAGCPVEVIDARRTRYLHHTAQVIAALRARARKVDLVLSNQTKGHVYGGLAALGAKRPAVWWQHGTPGPSISERIAAAIPARLIVAGSGPSVAAQRRLAPRRRVELVHPGIDVAAIAGRSGSGAEVRRALSVGDRPLVGIVGRLQPWKGQAVFLRAAQRVARTCPDARFVVVGGAILGWEGDYPEQLRELACDLGLDGRVEFVGHQDDVYPWFDALDVVVHASSGEPFGLVVVEAMALGSCVVAAADGGPLEIVEPDQSGLLVAPGDDEMLAAAIERVLRDDGLRARLGERARLRAWAFDERSTAARFAALLREVA